MPVANTESPSQRERQSESPPLQPNHQREPQGEIAPRRLELRPMPLSSEHLGSPTALEVSKELQEQSREWVTAVRLLEQSAHALNCAEMDRQVAYDEFARVVPTVLETSKQLTAAVDASRPGHPLSSLSQLFVANAKALEQLEGISVDLSSHFLRYRTAWEQYARSIETAQRLRSEGARVR
jgi:hypothetical protein